MEIYKVSDYLINLSEYKTDNIYDLFGIENKVEIVKILSHQKIWKNILQSDNEGINVILEPGFSLKENIILKDLPNGICLIDNQNLLGTDLWNNIPIDPIEPYYNLNNYTITKECIIELLKIQYYDKKLEYIFQNKFNIFYTNQDFIQGSLNSNIYYKSCLSLHDRLKEYDVPKNLSYNFSSKLSELIIDEIKIQKTRGENGEIVCRLPLPETKSDEELPYISIVTPTYNRSEFWELMYSNFKRTDYPKDRMEWIIVDDSPMNKRLKPFIVQDPRIKYHYIKSKKRLSIGKKRNLCAKYASHDYIVHMDDDDYYESCSVLSRIKSLIVQEKKCIGSTELVCYDLLNGVECYAYDESKEGGPSTISEASMAYTKEFWKERNFDIKVSSAESVSFVKGRENNVVILNGPFIVVGLTHGKNTVVRQKQIVQNLKEPFLDRIPLKVSNFLKNLTVKYLRNKKDFEEVLKITTSLEKIKKNKFEKVYNKINKKIKRHPFFRQRIHSMIKSEYEASQIVIFCHPNNKFSFYSDNNDVLNETWKKGIWENKTFCHNPEINFLIDFVYELSKEKSIIVYCPCDSTIKISKNLMFVPWYYFNVYRKYKNFISWNYYHFENYDLKIKNPILFLHNNNFINPESCKSFKKIIVNNEEFEWEFKCHLSDFSDYTETIEYGLKSHYFIKNNNDCVCITNSIEELTIVVRTFNFLKDEFPNKKLIWIGNIEIKNILHLKNIYNFTIVKDFDKRKIYNIIASSYYMIIPSSEGIWETLLGISHGCKVITLSKIKPFDTVFLDNKNLKDLQKYRLWVKTISDEWKNSIELDFKKQIKKIIQTNSIRNIIRKWLNVLNL